MQALDLNFATRPFRNNTLLWAGLALALIAIGALTLWNVQTYLESTHGLADLRQRAGDIESRRSDLARRDEETLLAIGLYELEPLAARAEKANDVIRWKAFSWTRLFNLLQDVQPYGVQMATISPVFRTEETGGRTDSGVAGMVPVTVDGVARGLEDFLDFQRDLLTDPHFDRVEPVRASTDNNSGETIFQLRFYYDPSIGSEGPTDLVADGGDDVDASVAEDATDGAGPVADEPGEEDLATAGEEIMGAAEPTEEFLAMDALEPGDLAAETPSEEPDAEPPPPAETAAAPAATPETPPAAVEEEPEEKQPRKRNPRRRGGGRKGANRNAAEPRPGTAGEADETPDEPGGASAPVEEAP